MAGCTVRPSASAQHGPDAYTEHPAPRTIRAVSPRSQRTRRPHRGRQDPPQAHGQDPRSVLPRRRHGLPHQAGRPGDRGDRQVPPHRGALGHPDRQRAGPVLARQRRPAHRGRRRPAEDHGDWQKYKGEPGTEGTLRVAAPKTSKKELYEAALAAAGKTSDDGSGATTPKKRPAKAAAEEPKAEEAKTEDAKVEEPKADEAPAAADTDSGAAATDSTDADADVAGEKA